MFSIGIDIVDIDHVRRILARSGETFMRRILSDAELRMTGEWKEPVEVHLAGRLAAKEAVLKAMGVGLKVSLKDISIMPEFSGKPRVVIDGGALKMAHDIGIGDIQISISHTGSYAVSSAIAVRKQVMETIGKLIEDNPAAAGKDCFECRSFAGAK